MSKKNLVFTALLSVIITALLFAVVSFKPANKEEIATKAEDLVVAEIEKQNVTEDVYLTKKGERLLEEKLMKPLRKKLRIKVSSNMFSRCPSGLAFYVIDNPTEENPYFTGVVENHKGCHSEKICDFRLNVSETQLQVMDENAETFVASEAWMKMVEKEGLASSK